MRALLTSILSVCAFLSFAETDNLYRPYQPLTSKVDPFVISKSELVISIPFDSTTTRTTKWDYRAAQWGPIDFRLSYWFNVSIDGGQTYQFPNRGITEENPFLSWAVTPKNIGVVFPIVSVLAVVGIDSFIDAQHEPDRTIMYGVAWLIHSYTITNNHNLGLKGLPVILPIFKARFRL